MDNINTKYSDACFEYSAFVNAKVDSIRSRIKNGDRVLCIAHLITETIPYFYQFGKLLSNQKDIVYTVVMNSPTAQQRQSFFINRINLISLDEVFDYFSGSIDILFLQNPYYNFWKFDVDFYGIMQNLPSNLLGEDPESYPLLCYIPYAYSVVNDSAHTPINGHYNLPLHNAAWLVFCESVWHKAQALSKSICKGRNYFVSGYPKLDDFSKISSVEQVLENKGTNNKFRIIWAPHHNLFHTSIPMDEVHDLLIQLMDENPLIEIIFRPHPNCLQPGFNEESIRLPRGTISRIVNFWSTHPRGSFDMRENVCELFSLSDIMLTDCGGFHIEYLATYKPVISYIRKDALNEFTIDAINDCGYWAEVLGDVSTLVNYLIIGEDREKKYSRLSYVNKNVLLGHASQNILDHVKSELFHYE